MSEDAATRIPASHLTHVDAPERRFRLLSRYRQALRTRRYSARTVQAYAGWVSYEPTFVKSQEKGGE